MTLPHRLVSVVLLFACTAPSAFALTVPRGFKAVDSAPGVTLYQYGRHFVQAISLADGARLHFLQGPFREEGMYGSFPRKRIHEWWSEFSEWSSQAFTALNGQFFNTADPEKTALAFSVKHDGRVYEGYADATEFPGHKRMLILDVLDARVEPYTDDPVSLVRHPAQNIFVGLDPAVAKMRTRPLARTFVGVAKTGEVLLFSSSMATQGLALRALRTFGAEPDQVVMLDGGKSASLVLRGTTLVPLTARGKPLPGDPERVPQALGVEAAW